MSEDPINTGPMGEAKLIAVEGIRTRYFEAGSGETLVLVGGGHFGSPYGATDWDMNFRALAAHFRVIAFDKLGQGLTDNPRRPGDYVIGSVVQHLRDLLAALEVPSAHFIGHSRGGYAVCRLAMESPALIRSLVVVDSGSLMHERSAFYPKLAERMSSIDDLRERYEYSIAEQSHGDSMVSEYWLRDILSFVTSEKYTEASNTLQSREPEFQEDLALRQHETREWIRSGGLGSIPVLLVWAYNDLGAPIDECGIPALHLFLGSTPDSRMHIFNRSGHLPFREWPQEFNDLIHRFVAGVASDSRPPDVERHASPVSSEFPTVGGRGMR